VYQYITKLKGIDYKRFRTLFDQQACITLGMQICNQNDKDIPISRTITKVADLEMADLELPDLEMA
jgi:hypothetical protein